MTNPSSNIDSLILQGEAGTQSFAEAVVREYYDSIYRLCLAIVSDHADANDAAQEAFIAALADIERYQPDTNFKGWLSTIAVNKCYGVLRRHKRQQAIRDALRFIREPTHHTHRRGTPGSSSGFGDDLQSAISSLSAKHEMVIRLRYVHGLSIREMASVLGVREGTVHSRLHYAMRNLRKHMTE